MCLHCVGKLIPRTLWSCHGDDNIFIFENINTNSSYSLCCEVVTQTIRDDSMSASASVCEQIYERSCTFAIAMKDQRRRKCGGKGVVEKKLLTMFFFPRCYWSTEGAWNATWLLLLVVVYVCAHYEMRPPNIDTCLEFGRIRAKGRASSMCERADGN